MANKLQRINDSVCAVNENDYVAIHFDAEINTHPNCGGTFAEKEAYINLFLAAPQLLKVLESLTLAVKKLHPTMNMGFELEENLYMCYHEALNAIKAAKGE